ncbi:SGNH/GDSL hydrolase family protein [Actinacidiphila acididurans]|uniref:SGNH/GDSL hydrolase family protein n=1 Tax=Actinacidiphila acididurans TaxID=2784346 RepID=A0ABS2U212_9ACTN|nr:SGNH/GDSL hydrolase family protein [Actinacidiphila acididurans]MBM9509629.1 SGNH/GDSL hydrolase family protein [Actinacidiphila acididurans]
MRPLLRRGLALAAGAVLLGGCGLGGSPSAGGRATPTAQISHSNGTERRPLPEAARPARPWDVHPASVAALGDSITRGFDACSPLADCPEVSWATGSRTRIDSLTQRLTAAGPATRGWNLAESGARVADLPGQARAAAAYRPAMVTVLIGANDACAATAGAMTTVDAFRSAFGATLAYLHKVLPATQVLVASVPDLRRLYSVGVTNPLEKQLWRLGLCPSMLKDADSHSASAQARRTRVYDRVVAYNGVLRQVCANYERCRYDNGAVFGYRFTPDELSKWDWFHPNEKGQTELARLMSAVAFGTAPAPAG